MNRCFRCLIVDDEALGRELLAAHLAKFEQFELVAACPSALDAAKYLAAEPIDVMFLDIEMPVLKGTEFYFSLKNKPAVIFTTAYRDYAVEGFELEAVDYLLKPIVFTRFFQAIERFLARQAPPAVAAASATVDTSKRDWLFVRENRKDIKLNYADILYIQSVKDYVQIHTRGPSPLVKTSISAFASRLNSDFVRVHRSYIVNRCHVTAITKHDIEMCGLEIPIGDSYRAAALQQLQVSG